MTQSDISQPATNKPDLSHIHTWIFDLDNTLYPRRCDLFAQIDVKMTSYVSELLSLPHDEARKIQKQYYYDHGTTLQGLILNHDIDPHHFLDMVHDIDYSPVAKDEGLRTLIQALPGRKLIFTNGDVPHAERTTKALGIDGCFEEIFDIVAADFQPKPAQEPYEKFVSKYDIDPKKAVMFEDMPANLFVPKQMGMDTVLIIDEHYNATTKEPWEIYDQEHDHIDHVTADLGAFLDNRL